ncbi:hypothetical protein M0R45_019915 [Rubus argutus]|uniref:Uncharacterized protein n=1 Tax=Rubus argutus TaxID=59490 RepID=A0AAW1X7A9_RUBAR
MRAEHGLGNLELQRRGLRRCFEWRRAELLWTTAARPGDLGSTATVGRYCSRCGGLGISARGLVAAPRRTGYGEEQRGSDRGRCDAVWRSGFFSGRLDHVGVLGRCRRCCGLIWNFSGGAAFRARARGGGRNQSTRLELLDFLSFCPCLLGLIVVKWCRGLGLCEARVAIVDGETAERRGSLVHELEEEKLQDASEWQLDGCAGEIR